MPYKHEYSLNISLLTVYLTVYLIIQVLPLNFLSDVWILNFIP